MGFGGVVPNDKIGSDQVLSALTLNLGTSDLTLILCQETMSYPTYNVVIVGDKIHYYIHYNSYLTSLISGLTISVFICEK